MKQKNIKKKIFSGTAFLIALMIFLAEPFCVNVSGEQSESTSTPLISYDFEEKEQLNDWHPIVGRIRMQTDSSNACSGSSSLKVDDRATCFDGPALDITDIIDPGTKYKIIFKCMYKGTNTDYIRVSVRKSFSGGDERFENLHWLKDIEMDKWIDGEADLFLSENVAKLELYFESGSRDSTIWLDDISIIKEGVSDMASEPKLRPEGTTLYDFEKDIDPAFSALRSAGLIRSEDAAFKGDHSLRICGRRDSRDGVSIDISPLKKNTPYRCNVQILFAAAHLEKEQFSIYLQYHTSETSYTDIAVVPSHEAHSGSWSSFGGIFTVPEEAVDPVLYITSVKPKDELKYKHVDFFLDDVIITDDLKTAADKLQSHKHVKLLIYAGIPSAVIITTAIVMLINSRRLKRKVKEASKDSMTGAYNRNTYEQRLLQLSAKPEKCKKLFFAVCDVNGLKYINDNFGHQTGDQCIIKCAKLLISVMGRHKGKVYRTGGDEFVCIAPEDFKSDLKQTLENEENSFTDYPFAVAAGASSYSPYEDGEKPDIKEIITRCDKEMYLDKKRKQNKKIQN